jgi:dTDP-4-dehydrorhamnose reductase
MAAVKNILVTGAGGQLGKEFAVLAPSFTDYKILFVTKEQLPIDDFDAVNTYIKNNNINCCINCAAYTAVDKAETEIEKTFLINATAAGNLAAACKQHSALFIHFSTDYVFNGNGAQPYKETDAVYPVNIYGQSKLKGEELVMQNNSASIIIRTSWVYSQFGNNFVKTMLRLMKEKQSINVVNDQFGSPTYAADLAKAVMQIIINTDEKNTGGIYHYCNEGIITWYDFAVAIKKLTGSNCAVNPVPSSQYPTPAKRPHCSLLDTTLIKKTFGLIIPYWKESLQQCLQLLQ